MREGLVTALRHAWRPSIKPTIVVFDPRKPKPDAFAAYTIMQLHEAYAAGLHDAVAYLSAPQGAKGRSL